MSQKSATFMAFWGQNFAKFRTPNFAKLILQALLSISRNFCNTTLLHMNSKMQRVKITRCMDNQFDDNYEGIELKHELLVKAIIATSVYL